MKFRFIRFLSLLIRLKIMKLALPTFDCSYCREQKPYTIQNIWDHSKNWGGISK